MNSGSGSNPNALSHQSSLENGHATASAVNGHTDSDTETIILSGDDDKMQKRTPQPHSDTDKTARPPKSPTIDTPSDSMRGSPSSRRSSTHLVSSDKKPRRSNGIKEPEPSSATTSHRPSSSNREFPSDRAQSADASLISAKLASDRQSSPNDSLERERKAVSVEPKKRKFSGESQKSKFEPPRQKPRLDSSSKASPTLSNRRISPPSPTTIDPPTHRRSNSTQSATKGGLRQKRAPSAHSHASDEKSKWADDSSDDSSTHMSRIPSLAPPKSGRSIARALISPARTGALPSRRADRYGATPLAKACEKGQLDKVIEAYDQAPEELDQEDNGGFAPLQKAALIGDLEIVKFLLDKGCRRDCCSKDDRDTPLIDAVENGHLEVVKVLLNAGVNPHHNNKKGVRAIDAINWEEDEAEELDRILKKAMAEYHAGDDEHDDPTQESSPVASRRERGTNSLRPDLLYQAHNKKTLLKYSTEGDTEAVGMFLESVVPDNNCIVAAARGGHDTTLSLLLASAPEVDKDPDPLKYEETPLLAAIGRSNLKVIRLLLDQDNFNPCRKTREGKTYYEVAEDRRGPRWQAEVELLKERYDAYKQQRVAKKKRLQDAKALARSGQSSKDLPAPKSPKLSKVKPKSEKLDDDQRSRRLSGDKDSPVKESTRRKRHVIEDDSSQNEGSDDDRRQKKITARKGSTSHAAKMGAPKSSKISKNALNSSTQVSPRTEERPKGKPGRKPKERKSIQTDDTQDSDIEMHDTTMVLETKDSSPDPSGLVNRSKKQRRVSNGRSREPKNDHHAEHESAAKKRKQSNDDSAREAREAEMQLKLEEERRRREDEETALRKRKEREERLSSLPPALRVAIERGRNRHLKGGQTYGNSERKETGVFSQFMPLHVFQRAHIDPGFKAQITNGSHVNGVTSSANAFDPDLELWVPSFFAVGILGLSELHLDEYPSWPKLPITMEQRVKLLSPFDLTQLDVYTFPQMGTRQWNREENDRRMAKLRNQFLNMNPLFWIRVQDLYEAMIAREDLTELGIFMFPDNCLRPRPSQSLSLDEVMQLPMDVPVRIESGAWVYKDRPLVENNPRFLKVNDTPAGPWIFQQGESSTSVPSTNREVEQPEAEPIKKGDGSSARTIAVNEPETT
jgi:ankyrin repeat protein